MKNNKYVEEMAALLAPFITLEELLSFGEIALDTVEPLADRFFVTYRKKKR